jgi:hypothetical protein
MTMLHALLAATTAAAAVAVPSRIPTLSPRGVVQDDDAGPASWREWVRKTDDRRIANGDAPLGGGGAPPPPPNSRKCQAVMEEMCSKTKAQGAAVCDACLQQNWPNLQAAGCDVATAAAFCPAPPPPGPYTPPAPAPVPPQPAGKPTGPNILLLFPDQWRYDWDGFTRDNQPDIPGPMLHVPTTRKVAASGTRFTTAYVPAPVCAPSRSCLASGREYGSAIANGQPGAWSNVLSNGYDYPVSQTTFYDVLRARGYSVMTTGKDDLTKAVSQLRLTAAPLAAHRPYVSRARFVGYCADNRRSSAQRWGAAHRWRLRETGRTPAARHASLATGSGT